MNVDRTLLVRDGDATGVVRAFLKNLWDRAGFEAMLLPVELPDGSAVVSQVVTETDELAAVNPFAPIMLSNSAATIGTFLQEHPKSRLAAMLRPCELRALFELQKRRRALWKSPTLNDTSESLLIIGVDCPGTLPAQEYTSRALAQGVPALARQALSFGFKGGLELKQMRTACQICSSLDPHGADITIGTIGLKTMQQLMVIARDEAIDLCYDLKAITDRQALEPEVVLREVAIGKSSDERLSHWNSLCTVDSEQLGNMSNLLACFTRCTMCADCLDACPLYEGELTGMLGVSRDERLGRPLLLELVAVGRWLASCSGCGMCQDACENGVPLTLLITSLSHRIQRELHYISGEPAQSLPWKTTNRPNNQRSQEEGMNALPY